MIDAFRKLHRFYRGFAGAERHLEETTGMAVCKRGCGRCCEAYTPSCMTIEALNAVSILTGGGNLAAAVSIAEGWLLERHNEAPSYEGMPAGCFVSPKIRDEFAAIQRLPCPFLNEAKECIIHISRPMSCRAFGVVASTQGICPRPPGKGETLTQLMYVDAPGLRQEISEFKQHYREPHPEWVTYSLVPTLIYRAAREKQFRDMVRDNRIASAKIIGTQIDTTLMWQPQVEAFRKGVAPDLIASMA